MTRSEKLKPVIKHVDKSEQTALKAVAFSQQQLKQQQDRLQQLISYKQEYANQQTSGKETFSALQLQENNRFFTQLNDTIAQQNQIVAMAQRELDIKLEKWKLKRSRSDAMHKVVDRIQESELKLADKVEQNLMDEVALRIALKSTQVS